MLLKSIGLIFLILLTACSDKPESGPEAVKWDRESCERCRMVLSDRHFATQVRYFSESERSTIVEFDDLGCAIVWLEDKSWMADERTEIWVTDFNSKEWINARTATYILDKTTPMNYGLGAQLETAIEGLNFTQAIEHINEIEKRTQAHRLQLQSRLKRKEASQEKTQ